MFKKIKMSIPEKMKPWMGFIGRLAFLLIVVWVIFGLIFGIDRMSGVAMNPSLKDGELMLYTRMNSGYKANDVVLYRHDGATQVSRVIATEDQIVDLAPSDECMDHCNDKKCERRPETYPDICKVHLDEYHYRQDGERGY